MFDFNPAVVPELPQKHRLVHVANELWQNPDVAALWLGGSLARGEGDPYSDVDLRVAVPPSVFNPERIFDGAKQLKDAAVAILPVWFGQDAMLFHMLLEDGEIYDLFIQTTERELTDETRLVLACRDAAFAAKLAGGADPQTSDVLADGEVIRQVLVNFWLGQQKHQKALYRDLPLLSWYGEHLLQQDLIRLWYVLATGNDCGPLHRATIHTLSPVARTVQQFIGSEALGLVGQSLQSKPEIVEATARLRDEVGRVGRQLADKLGFEYPYAAEATVQRTWQQFTALVDRNSA